LRDLSRHFCRCERRSSRLPSLVRERARRESPHRRSGTKEA
jgi:hypothetical protein